MEKQLADLLESLVYYSNRLAQIKSAVVVDGAPRASSLNFVLERLEAQSAEAAQLAKQLRADAKKVRDHDILYAILKGSIREEDDRAAQ